MNIYGYKQKRKVISKRLKRGLRHLGSKEYNSLLARRERIDYNIKKLRGARVKKWKN